MRFYDRMMAKSKVQRDIQRAKEAYDQLGTIRAIAPGVHVFPDATVIDATNVARYYYAHFPSGPPRDFEAFVPSLVPPFDALWIEVDATAVSRLMIKDPSELRMTSWGALGHSFDLWDLLNEDDPDARQVLANETAQHVADQVARPRGDDWDVTFKVYPKIKDDVRWISYWWLYLETDRNVYGPLIEVRMFIQPNGNIAGIVGSDVYACLVQPIAIEESNDGDPHAREEAMKISAMLMNPIWLAIGFCHCKNVTFDDGPMPHHKVQHKQEKKLGRGLSKFYTLAIEPMKEVLRTEGGADKVGLQRALHICRGHFVHYSAERPLFGRIAGTFWKAAHVRGRLDSGEIVKDYRVNGPKESAA